MRFLTSRELAERLRLLDRSGNPNPKCAKRLMEKWGIKPFKLGAGAGMGDRWKWEEVEDYMESLRQPSRPRIQKPRVKVVAKDYFDGPCRPRKSAA